VRKEGSIIFVKETQSEIRLAPRLTKEPLSTEQACRETAMNRFREKHDVGRSTTKESEAGGGRNVRNFQIRCINRNTWTRSKKCLKINEVIDQNGYGLGGTAKISAGKRKCKIRPTQRSIKK